MNRSRVVRLLAALILGVVLGGLSVWSFAAMSIYVCGSSTYTCASDDPVQSIGTDTPTQSICDDGGNCITVGTSPNFQGVTPSGWSGPNNPPATTAGVTGYKTATQGQLYPSPTAAGDAWRASNGFIKGDAPPDDTFGVYGCAATVSNCWATNNGKRSAALTSGLTCPSGYTLSGSTCNLSNAAAVQKPQDGKCSIIRTGNTYSGDPMDPDCAVSTTNGAMQKVNGSVSGGIVTASGGTPQRTVKVETDTNTGTTIVSTSTPNGDGITSVLRQMALGQPNGSGRTSVTGNSQSTVQGTGTLQGGSVAPTPNIPTDYAREATVQAIKNAAVSIDSKMCGGAGQPKCAINEDGTPSEFPATKFDTANTAIDQAVNDLKAAAGVREWSMSDAINPFVELPVVTGSDDCIEPGTWTWMGQTLNGNICGFWGQFKPWLAWLLYALTAVGVYRLAMDKIAG